MTAKKTIDTFMCDGLRFTLVLYPANYVMNPHCHNFWSMTLLLKGNIREKTSGTWVYGGSGQAMVKPTNFRHCNEIGSKGALVMSIASDRSIGSEPLPWLWLSGGMLSTCLAQFLVLFIENKNIPLRVKALDLAHNLCRKHTNQAADRKTVETLLYENEKDYRISTIARDKKVHPASFSRSFKRTTGLAPQYFRLSQRTFKALELILENNDSFAGIAAEAGFYDESHMARAMKNQFGVRPGALRGLATEFLPNIG
ncbi:MAG: helix-turn-helix transcriptional regulator [Proteobacteria bacterium]|nr:helix-turn-helix transcriptional regulator [Pseudomonadota bacterium]